MSKRGILVTNLGTPDAPTEVAVKAYLNEFLMDPKVIQLPRFVRYLLVRFIVSRRSIKTANAYKQIWTKEGSPLLNHSKNIADLLRSQIQYPVAVGMRYGKPTLEDARKLLGDVEEVVLLSPYPQYAESTTQSLTEHAIRTFKDVDLYTNPLYFNDTTFLSAQLERINEHLPRETETLIINFHGLPVAQIRSADTSQEHCLKQQDCCERKHDTQSTCYRFQCLQTANWLSHNLNIECSHSFSSRLGRSRWLKPYLTELLVDLAKSGKKNVAVTCPSFIVDNLETLQEVGIAARETFVKAGGKDLKLIPCVNNHPMWVEQLVTWSQAEVSSLLKLS